MYTLYHGDCKEYMKTLDAGSIDAIITDVPYGMNKEFENDTPEEADELFESITKEARRICKGNFLSFWSAQRMDKIAQFKPKRVLIWNKTWAIYTPNNVGYRYEPIFWMFGEKAYKKIGDIIEGFPIIREVQQESVNHPTQKPLDVLYKLVENFTLPGDVIFDPCMGSGTTGVAAVELGRDFIGCEKIREHFETAENRIKNARPPLFVESMTPPVKLEQQGLF